MMQTEMQKTLAGARNALQVFKMSGEADKRADAFIAAEIYTDTAVDIAGEYQGTPPPANRPAAEWYRAEMRQKIDQWRKFGDFAMSRWGQMLGGGMGASLLALLVSLITSRRNAQKARSTAGAFNDLVADALAQHAEEPDLTEELKAEKDERDRIKALAIQAGAVNIDIQEDYLKRKAILKAKAANGKGR